MKIKGYKFGSRQFFKAAVNKIFRIPIFLYWDTRADYYLKKLNAKTKSSERKIKVAFLGRMPEIWDKQKPVFDTMNQDESFETTLIVVPTFDTLTATFEYDYQNNYFIQQYPDAVRAYSNGHWIDLEPYGFDYIFLPRPYEMSLPKSLRGQTFVKFTKCCYIPYGFCGTNEFNKLNTQKAFFRHISFTFFDSDVNVRLLKKQFLTKRGKSLHHIYNQGYPALEEFFFLGKRKVQPVRILWTPRWSFDSKTGGSSFLELKDVFLNMARTMAQCVFIFRPHPLLFNELLREHVLTQADIDHYISQMQELNIQYDKGEPVNNLFKETDILISDYSSLLIQFFVTGRPIVYCENSVELNDVFTRMHEGMYVVHNGDDLSKQLIQLVDNKDDLCELRNAIISEFYDIHHDSTKRIVETIKEDYQQSCITRE